MRIIHYPNTVAFCPGDVRILDDATVTTWLLQFLHIMVLPTAETFSLRFLD